MLKEKINFFLINQDYKQLEEFFVKEENLPYVSENGMDLITLFMDFLKKKSVNKISLHIFENIFLHLALLSNPKEIFLGLLEQFDPMTDDSLVILLFPALSECSKRLISPSGQNYSSNLSMLFSTLLYYFESINLPKYDDFKPRQNSQDANEIKVALYISKCANINKTILSNISEITNDKEKQVCLDNITIEFKKFWISLLAKLSYLDLDEIQSSENAIYSLTSKSQHKCDKIAQVTSEYDRQSVRSAYELCTVIRNLKSPYEFFKILSWSDWCKNDLELTEEEQNLSDFARGMYVYLNLVKVHESYYFPQILEPQYVFLNCVPSILVFWNTSRPVQIHKGMEIAQCVCNRIAPQTLQLSYVNFWLRSTNFCNAGKLMLDAVIDIALHCNVTLLRQRAVQFIKKFLDKFTWPDRYHLLLHILMTTQHSGIFGYAIGYFKDKLVDILQSGSPKINEYFLNKGRFKSIIDLCCNLPDGSDTDLLAEYDKIVSSLNLLRFLLIRDTLNIAWFNEYLEVIQKQFLNPLRTAINLSKMHFSSELIKQSDTKKMYSNNEPALVLNGVSLPLLPLEDRKETINSAINSFDLLQSICIRVQELVDLRTCSGIPK